MVWSKKEKKEKEEGEEKISDLINDCGFLSVSMGTAVDPWGPEYEGLETPCIHEWLGTTQKNVKEWAKTPDEQVFHNSNEL